MNTRENALEIQVSFVQKVEIVSVCLLSRTLKNTKLRSPAETSAAQNCCRDYASKYEVGMLRDMYIPADISRHASATQKLLQKYGVRLRKYRNCRKNDGGRLQQYALAAGMKDAAI